MNLEFLQSSLWPMAALATVPILIHLFARSRPPPYRFSSVEFILRSLRQVQRIRRPQDWLLLALRTLLYAALILLFLRPVYYPDRPLAAPWQTKHVVLVVDVTASMGYTEGAQTRLALACAEASDILSGLSARDTANIVWLRARPGAVFPAMGVNRAYLQTALRQARVTAEAANVEQALAAAVNLLAEADGRREIHVLSDFQATAWKDVSPATPPEIALVLVRIGREVGQNAGIAGLSLEPARALAGEDVRLVCRVGNYSGRPARRTVFLSAAESRQTQDVTVPPWSHASVSFVERFAAAGQYPVTASMTEDAFSADDRRHLVVEVRDALRVGIRDADAATAAAWRRAAAALGWARPEPVSDPELESGPPCDALLLAGWDGAHPEAVRRFLDAGGTVVCAPAPELPVARLRTVLGAAADGATGPRLRFEEFPAARTLRVAAPEDRLFAIFAGGEHGNPAAGTFKGRCAVPPEAARGGETLLAYDDGAPALIRFAGRGDCYLWNCPLAPKWSDLAAQAEFLPLLGELLLTSRRAGAERGRTDYAPGEPLAQAMDGAADEGEIRLAASDGREVPVTLERSGPRAAGVARSVPDPGLYAWTRQGRTLAWSAVNFPVIESDLRPLPPAWGRDGRAIDVGGGRTVRRLREGLPLWPALLALAVTIMVAEGGVLLWVKRV